MDTDQPKKKIKLTPPDMEKQNDSSLSILQLPTEIILKIFEYLNYNDLCRAGRVCKQWQQIKKIPVLERQKVIANFPQEHSSAAVFKLLRILPPDVTYMKLNFEYPPTELYKSLNVFMPELNKKLPNFKLLTVHRVNACGIELNLEFCKDFIEKFSEEYIVNEGLSAFRHSKFTARQLILFFILP